VPEAQRALVEGAREFSVALNARPGKTWRARLREGVGRLLCGQRGSESDGQHRPGKSAHA